MRPWALALAPPGDDAAPLFSRIARAISDDVRRGRLRAGAAMPGSRALADTLGVNRNTVLAAYRELIAEGWLVTEAARGTFVSKAIPDVAPKRFAPAAARSSGHAGFDVPSPIESARASPPPGVISLGGGLPDVRLAPADALARAYRRALKRAPRELLSYGDERGYAPLRAALATMLSDTRGVAATPDRLLVTRGSQMAIDLVARTMITPGDVVAVESLGYRPAWGALRMAGAELVALPVDASGVRVDALEALLAKRRVRAIYVTPHHQYPTTVALAPGRRLALLDLAARHRVAIIEDDYDHEFHYDGRPLLPLASADAAGVVIYVGTLSKVLAPGIRLGYLVAPESVVELCASARVLVDRQGDLAIERAVAELIEDGEVQRHIRRVRRIYAERRDAFVDRLRKTLGSALEVTPPAGGTALWAKVARDLDVDAWAARSIERGVFFQPGSYFTFDRRASPSFARFGFAQLAPREMPDALAKLASALPRHFGGQGREARARAVTST